MYIFYKINIYIIYKIYTLILLIFKGVLNDLVLVLSFLLNVIIILYFYYLKYPFFSQITGILLSQQLKYLIIKY